MLVVLLCSSSLAADAQLTDGAVPQAAEIWDGTFGVRALYARSGSYAAPVALWSVKGSGPSSAHTEWLCFDDDTSSANFDFYFPEPATDPDGAGPLTAYFSAPVVWLVTPMRDGSSDLACNGETYDSNTHTGDKAGGWKQSRRVESQLCTGSNSTDFSQTATCWKNTLPSAPTDTNLGWRDVRPGQVYKITSRAKSGSNWENKTAYWTVRQAVDAQDQPVANTFVDEFCYETDFVWPGIKQGYKADATAYSAGSERWKATWTVETVSSASCSGYSTVKYNAKRN
ncbi:MAG: hypothetical protein FJ102_14065 [Deltaproteobacteria bacterium]|nr:hypothetical protein [Deltaproteobacteria bacterium]